MIVMRKKIALAAAIGLSSALLSTGSMAIPSVSYEGADVTVNYTLSGQTASFDYIFAVGNAMDAANWIGTTMDALSIQFGSAGNGTLVSSISATSSNSANVSGVWTGFQDKVSGNGCSGNNADAACYTRLGTGTVDTMLETVIAASTTYNFMFDVVFNAGVNVADTLAGTHSIKFLSLECKKTDNDNKCTKWGTGLQLSESGHFNPDNPTDPDNPVPVPGTLALFGLGILGLHRSHRRRRHA